MALFSYSGRDADGEKITGRQEAAHAGQVADWLSERGIVPVEIRPLTPEVSAPNEPMAGDIRLLQRLTLDDLILFSRQMYSLTKAGVPITRAMRGLARSVRKPQLSRTLDAVTDDLEQGYSLSGSLHKHPQVFSRLYVSLIHVGENTGNLDHAFQRIAAYLEFERDTRRNLKAAVRYPLFVITAIGVALVILNLWVIPAFAGVFDKLGAELPWQTRVLIGVSDFMRGYWYLLLALLLGGGFAFARYVRTDSGRFRWDALKLRLPLVGGLFRRIALGRFCRSFALVLRAGIPIEQGLALIADALGNRYVGSRVQAMRDGIERGEGFTRAAHSTGMFSPMVLQMLAVGEETGQVDELLEEVAEFYEQEVAYDLKGLASSIEPVLIVAIGAMVLVLALGVFLPLWDISSAMRAV